MKRSRAPDLAALGLAGIAVDHGSARVDELHPPAVGRPIDSVRGDKASVDRTEAAVRVEAEEFADRIAFPVLE